LGNPQSAVISKSSSPEPAILSPMGEVGETVVRIIPGSGSRSATSLQQGAGPCGRTNMRINGWMGRADKNTKVKGMFVRPEQIAEIGKRHPELGRLRLVVTRAGESDLMTLKAECGSPGEGLQDRLAASLRAVTKLGGSVELVPLGSLPNDGKVISDERGLIPKVGFVLPHQ
jgi:phenylacetate-CoA ligase